eukprot:CAMPEP_0201865610 /NCGR_PEP_ID=MMETSP0902-20130614/442_1 /ASSEMBLY_ACC=CAM_ASM_000551 /TAXON_ID=420261 /ORGANISM="Thalassiosira antarctica, Strain CCMP982" /LENGTH=66 /DNA_ID=CAMNT_0048390401 /DNA_START=126 /DNA_END=326 /DNA_ORIENTATION=+
MTLMKMKGAVSLVALALALALEGGITGTRACTKAAAVILFDDEKARSMECDVTDGFRCMLSRTMYT